MQPKTLHGLLDRVTELARRLRVTRGRNLRIDSTVVPTAIQPPTDGSLLTLACGWCRDWSGVSATSRGAGQHHSEHRASFRRAYRWRAKWRAA